MISPLPMVAASSRGTPCSARLRRWMLFFLPVLLGTWFYCLPAAAENRIRENALAGSWYPADPEALRTLVTKLLDAADTAPDPAAQPVRALIVPHAGYQYSGSTAARGFGLIRGRRFTRVMILAPAHRSGFSGLSVADVDYYQTPLGDIPLDEAAISKLRESPLVSAHPSAHRREHSIEIELPLLQQALAPGWKLLPVLVGRLGRNDYRAAARLLRPLADQDTLVVVSSDFTHYGERFAYRPFPSDQFVADNIRQLDAGALSRIVEQDRGGFLTYQENTGITICGYRPIALLLEMLPDTARLEQIAYTTSGKLTGDWENSVSYALVVVSGPEPISAERETRTGNFDEGTLAQLHQLAVAGIDWAVLGGSEENMQRLEGMISELPPELKEIRGAFVTLKQDENLRGCIGHPYPDRPLYLSILESGYNAAVQDHRFRPVGPEELKGLEIEISLLTPPVTIDSPEEFIPEKHGIILNKGGRRAVFLPQVAKEQGWSREETLSNLSKKAGLPYDAWKEGAELEIFQNQKYSAPYPSVQR